MALPYPTKVVLPFDIATAQDMNERHANDVALAAGTGLDDGAVTPSKRGGGFKIGVIPGSTFSTTGDKIISGVGFRPKLVRFTTVYNSGSTVMNFGTGAMTSSNQYYAATYASSTSAAGRAAGTDASIGFLASPTDLALKARYVSMNSDGFTLNVVSASGSFDIAYEAYA